MKPLLIVISAPSGAGKTTLCDRLLQDYPELTYSVSCTTRKPRGEEEDGVDYHFMTDAQFDRLVKAHRFLEHAKVHGFQYGTLSAPVREAMAEGQSVLMDIDVAGAAQIREKVAALEENDPLRRGFLDIFVRPPSLEALRERMEARGEDNAETIERRMRNASRELARSGEFRYALVNDNLDIAYRELCAIIEHAGGVMA
ncbi:MAG: guanylate kinase [Kiritimatiellae bacterium]|nr:guanylate kinase [Kiritimatiellia bacterium]